MQAYDFVIKKLEEGHARIGVSMPTGCGKQLLMYLLRFGLKHKEHGRCGRCLYLAPYIHTNEDNYKGFQSEVLEDKWGVFAESRKELDTIRHRGDTVLCTDSKNCKLPASSHNAGVIFGCTNTILVSTLKTQKELFQACSDCGAAAIDLIIADVLVH